MRNPGKIPAFLIEVQSGSYLGEDDIVRYDDVYLGGGEVGEGAHRSAINLAEPPPSVWIVLTVQNLDVRTF